MSDGLTDEQRQEVEAVRRVLKGEHPHDVARELGLSPAVLSRTADELIRPEVLKACLERMAVDYGFVGQMEFPFPLLSDADEKLCALFDVIKMKNMYGKKVRGIERSTFLIDAEGKLAREWRKVKVDGHAAEVLDAVKAL